MSSFKKGQTMDYKSFLTNEELFDFFIQNKSKISTIENPLMFLRLLKDNGLVTDELYQTLENSGGEGDLYPVLEYIQKLRKKKVRKFWDCVDQEHILQRYPQLSELIEALKNYLLPELDSDTGNGDTEKERKVKKRKTEDSCTSLQAGPSSQNTYKQRKIESEDEERARNEDDLWDRPEHKKWLPVTCGGEEANLDRETLRNYGKKKECIKYGRTMITPYIFEKLSGKGHWKNWKTSITCQGKTIKQLLEKGVLQMTEKGELNNHFSLYYD